MQNPFGGYTLLEVMLFVAISGLLLVAAAVTVGNQQAHTEFTTSVNDVNTKMRQWINQVTNGFTGSTADSSVAQYACRINATSGGYPELYVEDQRERGTNPQCVFLGKAIQISDHEDFNDRIFAYTILGRRIYDDAGGQPALVDSLLNARPIAAYFPPIDLTEEYRIPNGLRIESVRNEPPAGGDPFLLTGFYSSFHSTDLINGARSLITVQYPFTLNDVGPRTTSVLECIRLQGSICGNLPSPDTSPNPWPMTEWHICLASTRNDEKATLSVVSTNGRGATTTLDLNGCEEGGT